MIAMSVCIANMDVMVITKAVYVFEHYEFGHVGDGPLALIGAKDDMLVVAKMAHGNILVLKCVC